MLYHRAVNVCNDAINSRSQKKNQVGMERSWNKESSYEMNTE